MMNTYIVNLIIQAGEFEKSSVSLVKALTESHAMDEALLGESHGSIDDGTAQWTSTGILDLGGEFHYRVDHCYLVKPEHVEIMTYYLNGVGATCSPNIDEALFLCSGHFDGDDVISQLVKAGDGHSAQMAFQNWMMLRNEYEKEIHIDQCRRFSVPIHAQVKPCQQEKRHQLTIIVDPSLCMFHFCREDLSGLGHEAWYPYIENELFQYVERFLIAGNVATNVVSLKELRQCGVCVDYQVIYNQCVG